MNNSKNGSKNTDSKRTSIKKNEDKLSALIRKFNHSIETNAWNLTWSRNDDNEDYKY